VRCRRFAGRSNVEGTELHALQGDNLAEPVGVLAVGPLALTRVLDLTTEPGGRAVLPCEEPRLATKKSAVEASKERSHRTFPHSVSMGSGRRFG